MMTRSTTTMTRAGGLIRLLLPAAIFLLAAALSVIAAAQPAPPVRVIAEWEPALGTLISWPLGIPQGLVVELAEDDMLYVLVTGQSAENQATSTLGSWGIDPAQVEYIHTSVQTHWPRDWGPHQIFDGNGDWAVVDPIFEGYPWVGTPCEPINSPGGYTGDNAVNIDVAAYFSAPLHTFPAYLTGGNFLVDGNTAAFSTCAMVGENNQLWTEAEFLDLAETWLGVTDYHVLDNTENNGIQHIDCWFKPLDEETLLVKLPPTWHEEYTRIEANLTQLSAAVTCYGRPYRIIRIDCPPYDGNEIAAYCNSLILNNKVLVPQFNIPGDTQAIATFEAAMPGYEVIGFPWGSWYYYDALHCRTRAVFDREMLHMRHMKLEDEVPQAASYEVTAFIDDRSESGLIAGELKVHWRLAGETVWNEDLLTASGSADMYAATIPGQTAGAVMEYYLAAADNSGRSESMPRTAPDGFYSFTVTDTGLTITVVDPPSVLAPQTGTTFEVTVDPGDESMMPGSALLHWRYDGGVFQSAALAPISGTQYEATLPPAGCSDTPEFYVSAEGDQSGLKTDPAGAPGVVFTAAVGQLMDVTVMAESFETGLPAGWSADGLWHVTSSCQIPSPPDGMNWTYYGQDGSCDYNTGARTSGTLASAPIDLPQVPDGGRIILTYGSNLETENESGYDVSGFYVNDALYDSPAESAVWETRSVDLTALAGQTVTLEWRFDSVDDYHNAFHGWQVDGIVLTASELDCSSTLTLDAGIVCAPSSGTLPFSSQMTVSLSNLYDGLTRRLAARIDVTTAAGATYSNWKSGWSNVAAGEAFEQSWTQSLPALGSLVGNNMFMLEAVDVTPPPYNQPPHPPAGDVDADVCTVTGEAP